MIIMLILSESSRPLHRTFSPGYVFSRVRTIPIPGLFARDLSLIHNNTVGFASVLVCFVSMWFCERGCWFYSKLVCFGFFFSFLKTSCSLCINVFLPFQPPIEILDRCTFCMYICKKVVCLQTKSWLKVPCKIRIKLEILR